MNRALVFTFAFGSPVASAQNANVRSPLNLLEVRNHAVKSWYASREAVLHSDEPVAVEPSKTIETWIKDTLLPQSEVTRRVLQNEMDIAAESTRACSKMLRDAEQAIKIQEYKLGDVEAKHHECELAEASKHAAEEQKCHELLAFARSLKPPTKISAVPQNDLVAIESVLKANVEYFDRLYPEYMQHRHVCNQATAAEQKMHHECQNEKAVIMEEFCGLKGKSHKVCLRYEECYNEHIQRYSNVRETVQALEADIKGQFSKLFCYDDHLFTPQIEATCKDQVVDTGHLDISYPSKPLKETCSESIHTRWNYSFECKEAYLGDQSWTGYTGMQSLTPTLPPKPDANSSKAIEKAIEDARAVMQPTESTEASVSSPADTDTDPDSIMSPVDAENYTETPAVAQAAVQASVPVSFADSPAIEPVAVGEAIALS